MRTTHYQRFSEPCFTTLETPSLAKTKDDPNYYARSPRSLLSSSTDQSFMVGTGASIYSSLAPLLETTNHELILVTCFWARSPSLDTLNGILRKLSRKAVQRGTDRITVRLCFSSLSLFQKLFHALSVTGQEYPPSAWTKIGLPEPSELRGLDLRVKSVFLLPFSVMHPKFAIIDRKTVVLPSCNVSWEEWFEGSITFSGPIVSSFTTFYSRFWERRDLLALPNSPTAETQLRGSRLPNNEVRNGDHAQILTQLRAAANMGGVPEVPTIFLPSPHHRNPHFQPFAAPEKVMAPPTPLNTFILTLFAKAEESIRIQTPNITSPPVLSSLFNALERGVNVQILTSERLMRLEQIVTAGTTTARCIEKLIRRYKTLLPQKGRYNTDEEAAICARRPGRLRVSYFRPEQHDQENPQQSHLKMTIVDGDVVVLGSGNLDRASWFTSQELGVAFFNKELVSRVEDAVDKAMQGRSKLVYDSGEHDRIRD